MVLLSEPGKDFTGGEFVLTEQRPRMQSRVEVVPLGLVMARCAPCPTGPYRGAGRLPRDHATRRQPAAIRPAPDRGVIFHDAK